MRRAAGAPRSFSFSFSFSDAAASPSPACALRSGRLALLPAVRGAGRCSPSMGPPLTWASSPTRAPATRAQGEDGSRDRASGGPGRAALPGTAFAQHPRAEPSPGAGPGVQERRPGARVSSASSALHGPRLPSSEKSGNGSPLAAPGSEERGALERTRAVARRCFGLRGGSAGSRCARTLTRIQPCGIGAQIS